MRKNKEAILIIDDAPTNLKLLTAALTADYSLQIAHSGAMGLQVASNLPPDLILLDVMMPEMNGFEVCRHLKANPALWHIPVIFLTALGDAESETMGLSLGAADYIAKPINVETARHRIFNLLERERLRKEVEAHRDHLEEKVAARTMALSIAKEAVEASHRVKANFLNNMTHELRSPMAIIMGYTELSLRIATDPSLLGKLGKVQEASEQLLALITNLIDVTALESRQLSLASNTFTLASVLDGIVEQLGRQAAKKGLEFNVKAESSLRHLPVQGDSMRLGQILQELAGNAIKYTHHGVVAVEVEMLEQSDQDINLRFTVRDTGIGIALADRKRIFELFEQIDGSSTRNHGGTGLGLALCQQLVDLMKGTFGIDSKPGVGSAFWLTLRLPKANLAPSSDRL